MRSLSLFLLAFLMLVSPLFACINESGTQMQASLADDTTAGLFPYGHNFKLHQQQYEQDLVRLNKQWVQNHDIDAYLDYGVRLVYLGRYDEAKAVFRNIEKRQPGRYATAANLGTTYELLGQNDSALLWIKKGVAINPESHEGSEWIHVQILEAKIGGDKYINSNFLLNTNFGEGVLPTTTLKAAELDQLAKAIHFQLNERVSFIKAKDPIVALLLFELGNIVVLQKNFPLAQAIYNRSNAYGNTSALLAQRLNNVLQAQGRTPVAASEATTDKFPVLFTMSVKDHPAGHYVLAALGLVLISYLVLVAVKRG